MKYLLLAVTMLFILSCEKEVLIKQPPQVETSIFQFIGDQIYLEGNVLSNGGFVVQEYGFELKEGDIPSQGTSNVISVRAEGLIDGVGYFNKSIVNTFLANTVYSVRAYLKVNNEVYYGSAISFDGLAKSKPTITDFEPNEGFANDFVKIYGSNFSLNLKVFFDEEEVEIVEQTFDRLIVKVPSYKVSKLINLIVKDGSTTYSIGKKFTLIGPVVTELISGATSSSFTLVGKNFSSMPWRNTVKIGKYLTKVVAATSTSLAINVDTNSILPGAYPITVESDGITSVSSQSYNITSPWVRLRDKPDGGLAYSTSFEINGKIYVCSGYGPTQMERTKQVWEYDIASDSWTRKADFGGGTILEAVGFAINGKGYIGTGYDSNGVTTSDFWEYDPSLDQWTKKAEVPGGSRAGAVGFSFNGKGYVGLGRKDGSSTSSVKDIWEFDPTTNFWTELPEFDGNGRVGAEGVIFNDKIFIVGGADANSSFEPDTWSFNSSNNIWVNHGLNKFVARGLFNENNKCYIMEVVNNFFFESEIHLIEYNPELNTIVSRDFPIFPAGVTENGARGVPVITTIHNQTIYIGLGPIGGFFDCLNDLWKFKLN